MNFHSTSLRATGVGLSRCVSLTLLSILGSECFALTHPQRVGSPRLTSNEFQAPTTVSASAPYLTVVLAPALTFHAAPPPLDPSLRLAAGAPPRPASSTEDAAPVAEETAVEPVATIPQGGLAAEPAPLPDSSPVIVKPRAPSHLPPVAILRDDTLPEMRPEDVLPYFQYPGPLPAAPLPAAVSPSAATYRQR